MGSGGAVFQGLRWLCRRVGPDGKIRLCPDFGGLFLGFVSDELSNGFEWRNKRIFGVVWHDSLLFRSPCWMRSFIYYGGIVHCHC